MGEQGILESVGYEVGVKIETVTANPEKSFSCLALVKRQSKLHREIHKEWNISKMTYCIYEYDKAFDSHEVRWCDGSWRELSEEYFGDVVLLRDFDDSTWGEILGE